MKIDSAAIGMESARLYRSSKTARSYNEQSNANYDAGSALSSFANNFSFYNEKKETKTVMVNVTNGSFPDSGERHKSDDTVIQNMTPKDSWPLSSFNGLNAVDRLRLNERDASETFQKLHELMVKRIWEMLFGRRIKNSDAVSDEEAANTDAMQTQMQSAPVQLVTLHNYIDYTYSEEECTSFSATGTVNTADGRSINLNIDVSMTRSFTSYYKESFAYAALQAVDPLVINLDSSPAELSDMKILFDLDCDGQKEEISRLKSNSGFLALDKNNDGIINDGSELFGTTSGDGFRDLAAYDSDGNGWIDENDEVFDMLKIWVTDASGNSSLYSIRDANVGALYLGSVDTDFTYTSILNDSVNGYARSTGFFLYEDGTAGTLQHIDLVS